MAEVDREQGTEGEQMPPLTVAGILSMYINSLYQI